LAERMLADAGAALIRRDAALARSVIVAESRIDALHREVEEHAILTIAGRQTFAIDLRATISPISPTFTRSTKSSKGQHTAQVDRVAHTRGGVS
jgi:hypothetical protein